ncbi:uncharacterized protein LOC132799572 isoform X2 [Ziziphus jujuba]|uniref:Uncharacterized protein LOC132799572 isoform X2 n=1 Tax=Ziziphus jujuba TaxID=326968 RepID=A0ABM3ZTG5_ZIZJJ|nr:uncharacterized protein LOC132799572 isoform X2 [Ziziphus jujuba]
MIQNPLLSQGRPSGKSLTTFEYPNSVTNNEINISQARVNLGPPKAHHSKYKPNTPVQIHVHISQTYHMRAARKNQKRFAYRRGSKWQPFKTRDTGGNKRGNQGICVLKKKKRGQGQIKKVDDSLLSSSGHYDNGGSRDR